MIKPEHVFIRDFFLVTKSPARFNLDFITQEEATGKSKCRSIVIVFDDKLHSNQKAKDPFFAKGRHEDSIFITYLNHISTHQKNKKININIIVSSKQTLGDVKNIYRDIAGLDMNCAEYKNRIREPWKHDYNIFCFVRPKDNVKKNFCNCNEDRPYMIRGCIGIKILSFKKTV